MEYLTKMKSLQEKILEFLDNDNNDNIFDDLKKILFSFQQNQSDRQELKSVLYLISKITKNHHRTTTFFDKIKKILNLLKNEIIQTFSNVEIFQPFKNNKRILLLLINEGILIFDNDLSTRIDKYKEYFYLELNKINQKKEQNEIPENYEEKRLIGENNSYICELIRNDDIVEFIVYCTKKSISLSNTIESSIYETNSFLINKKTTLIEYSAFFGSIQIFRYLFQNGVELKPSLWLYAIHGKNPEIIHFLEDNRINPNDITYQECLKESIKCHHNDFAIYIKDNKINEIYISSNYFQNEIKNGFHYYNFQFIPLEIKKPFCFYYAIEYDNYKLVEYYKDIEEIHKKNYFLNTTALKLAFEKNNNDVYNYLIKLPGIEIGCNCFSNCDKLIEFDVPSSITFIGDYSFLSCKFLTKITIPSSVTSLGNHCFSLCSSLKYVKLPSSLLIINEYAFDNCIKLEDIDIPTSVTTIGRYAFNKCTSLSKIIVPSSVTSIGDNFICECINLSSIIISSQVKNIGILKFQEFHLLKEFIFPSSVTRIYEKQFENCDSLNNIEIPSTVKFIEKFAFSNCHSLKKITIPPSITSIEDGVFEYCSSLKVVNIPSSVTSIGFNVFHSCHSLVNITIPSSVRTIGYTAFLDCTSLKNIIIEKSSPSSIEEEEESHEVEIITKPPEEIKVTIMGDIEVGKSCILSRYINNEFDDNSRSTIGAGYAQKKVYIQGNNININIWDTSGNERFRCLCKFYYRGARCIIVVFDASDSKTLCEAETFFKEVHDNLGSVPSVLLGNKCELEHEINEKDIKELEKKYNTKYFEVSAKNNYNVNEAFEYLIDEVIKCDYEEKSRILSLINNSKKNSSIY